MLHYPLILKIIYQFLSDFAKENLANNLVSLVSLCQKDTLVGILEIKNIHFWNLTKMTENLAKILCGKITNLQGNVRHNEEEPTSVYHYRKVGISSTLFKLIQY